MNWDTLRRDLSNTDVKNVASWHDRWLAMERLRLIAPTLARLAVAGEALAAGVKRCVEGDHRDLDHEDPIRKNNTCTHGRHWFEDCEACVDQVLHPLLEAWTREAEALAAINPTAPWSRPHSPEVTPVEG